MHDDGISDTRRSYDPHSRITYDGRARTAPSLFPTVIANKLQLQELID
jgi:hypothetical protein